MLPAQAMAGVLENKPTEILILHSGKKSVDGKYKLLPQQTNGEPAYERQGGKKPMFLFFSKKWRIGGVMGDKRASVMTLSDTCSQPCDEVWQRYERAADGGGRVNVECHAMKIIDAATAPGDLTVEPPLKKRRTHRDAILRIPTCAIAVIFASVGTRGRFLLGSVCKAARRLLFKPQLWHTVHLDHASLSELVLQITHARKQAIGWLDTGLHPMLAARSISITLSSSLQSQAGAFRSYHLTTLLRPFLRSAHFVQVTGSKDTMSFREFSQFVVWGALILGRSEERPVYHYG